MELLLPRWYVRPYQAAVPLLVSYSTAPCVRLCGIHVHLSIFASYTCKHTYMVTRHPPRCSGDFSQCKQTKYNMALPGLPERVIAQQLASDLNDMEKTVAAARVCTVGFGMAKGLPLMRPTKSYRTATHVIAYTHT